PSLLFTSVRPLGSAPDSAITIEAPVGKPLVVTVKVAAVPTANVALLVLVIAGAWFTVIVNDCVALGGTPLLAVIVIWNEPPEPPPGVPEFVAVPSLLFANVMPGGSAPVWEITIGDDGEAVVVTVKVPATPTLNVALFALVIAGAWSTRSVIDCVASGVTP